MELLRKTNQGAFDMVVRRLFDGKGRAVNSDGSCVYRGSGGNKCAVGCLIPNKYYYEEMEGATVGAFTIVGGNVSVDLLSRLQDIHDDSCCWDGKTFIAVDVLYDVAEQYELKTKVLDMIVGVK